MLDTLPSHETSAGEDDQQVTIAATTEDVPSRPEPLKDKAFGDDLYATVPSLKTFAHSLTGNPSRTDDLVQETMMKAWQYRARFQPGTNLHAWLFTILRNAFYSEHRKRTREVEDQDGAFAARVPTMPTQEDALQLENVRNLLDQIPAAQRDALRLVAEEDLSYEEAATILGCKLGTVKSRVSRAREHLSELSGYEKGSLSNHRTLAVVVSA